MKKIILALLMSLIFAHSSVADKNKEMTVDDIIVLESKLITPTKQPADTVYTGSEITRKGIEIQGSKAASSIYEAINILPGISVESPDPHGLSAEGRIMRVRGVRGSIGAMTVEGVPNWGGNPIGPREYIYDTENLQSIAVYKGAVPADFGTGIGSRGGAIELRPRWPHDKFGLDFSQAFGSNHYGRSYLRLDSGKLPLAGTSISGSYSLTSAEKWKGKGELGPRNNVNLMLKKPIGKMDQLKVWFNYNDVNQHLYRPLTYSQTQSLDLNNSFDYNMFLTGTKAQDINYYNYNRGSYNNKDMFAIIPLPLSDAFRLTFKPYYALEQTQIFNGSTSQGGLITKRNRDIKRQGIISQMESKFGSINAALGYWIESSDMNITSLNYDPLSFAFRGYGIYTESDGNGIVHSPYAKLSGVFSDFEWQGGLKFFQYNEPSTRGFVSIPPAFNLVHAQDLDRDAKNYSNILPSIGAGYNMTDSLKVYVSYARNQIRPYSYVPIINLYNQNRAVFQKAGITLNDLFKGYDMEISENFEFGLNYRKDIFDFRPAIFYATHKNLLTSVFDPRVNLNYQQNVGKATGIGFEAESNLYIGKDLTFFFNPTFTSLSYDDDLVFLGKVRNTKGNQIVDVPKWLIKTGLIFKFHDFELVPQLRYMTERYGDSENTEKIADNLVTDLNLSYVKKNLSFTDSLKISLQLHNLLNTKYVPVINASDDTRAGNPSYYTGAPFTAVISVAMGF